MLRSRVRFRYERYGPEDMFLFVNPGSGGNKGKARAVARALGFRCEESRRFPAVLGSFGWSGLRDLGLRGRRGSGHEWVFGLQDVAV